MKQYKNYIFDLDGTLLDTLGDLAASTNYALRHFGLPERSIDEVRQFVGNGVRKLIERAVAGTSVMPSPTPTAKSSDSLVGSVGSSVVGNPSEVITVDDVLKVFQQHYLHHNLDTTKPYDGIIHALETLKGRGCGLAVVSNKFDKATKGLCAHFFGSLIDAAIGENEAAGIRKKPAPDSVLEAMRLLRATPDDTVYVGDSDVDILTARNASLPCISVLWGFRDKDFLIRSGATTFIEKASELEL